MMIVLIASALIVIILLGLVARFVFNKMRADKARAEQIKITQANLNKGQIRVIPKSRNFNQDPDNDKIMQEENPSGEEIYEE